MANIFVVDDDLDMLELIQKALQKDGHQVYVESDSTKVKGDFCRRYDLILLDVMMPGEDGFSLCSRIRDEVDVPILFLTAKTEDADIVQGLGLGGDDYIKKPFSLSELRARVNAHLRRQQRRPVHALNRNGIYFDMQSKTAAVSGNPVGFTKSEYEICEYLALHPGQVFTKEQLYEHVFGFNAEGDSSAVAEHIKNIRGKLKKWDLSPVETVWGVGYKWTVKDTL